MNIWILKLDSNGVVSWQKTYDSGYAQDNAYSIRQTSDGGYIIQAVLNPADYQVDDRVCVLKLDESGNISWQKTYGGNKDTQAYSIRQTLDEGYIVAAEIRWRDIWRRDIWLLKLDNNGEIPGCPIMDSIYLNVVDTNVVGLNSDVTIQSPSILISNTNATVNETLAELSVTCTAQIDPDNDEILYDQDNCPYIYNPEQTDTDDDDIGDVCDQCPYDYENDSDGDGICGDVDNCPDIPNPAQEDAESDGVGDVCDEDDDNDGQFDTSDNCPYIYNPDQFDSDGDIIGDACDENPDVFDPMVPVADGHYKWHETCYSFLWDCICDYSTNVLNGINVGYEWYSDCDMGFCDCDGNYYRYKGILEFDIAKMHGLFVRNQIEATLHLTVKNGNLSNASCLSFYSIEDVNENGIVETTDINTEDYLGEICEGLQPGDTITIDVTSALEHDLFSSGQTNFSGFVLRRSTNWEDEIEFYDHTDFANGPRLSISDGDGIFINDNCPYHYNPEQVDTCPPQGNGIGDACDCEGNFDCDTDCDGTDAATFKVDFGRSIFGDPCEEGDPCNGDFDCDGDCDGTDVALFKVDFGRSSFNDPCPACVVGEWCNYPLL